MKKYQHIFLMWAATAPFSVVNATVGHGEVLSVSLNLWDVLWNLPTSWGFKRYENIIKLFTQIACNLIMNEIVNEIVKWCWRQTL